jgi:hypothetical protein
MCSALRLVSLSLVLGCTPVLRAHGLGTDEMADAANALLRGLTPELRAKAALPMSSSGRKTWSGSARDRTGVALDELGGAQRAEFDELLKNGLSPRGYEAVVALMKVGPGVTAAADPARYTLTIFGKPSEDTPWAWRVDGPEVSLNFTIADADNVAVTPAFFGGSDPATGRGNRSVLAEEESLGLAFVSALTDDQRQAAALPGDAPGRLLAGGNARLEPLMASGLTHARMTPAQRQQLVALVTLHARCFRLELGDEILNKIIAAGWDTVNFAWAGGLAPDAAHYYRIQGPTFVIEFSVSRGATRSFQSVFRDFDGDFGRDLLGER